MHDDRSDAAPGENAPPPLWFGLVFFVAGVCTVALGMTVGGGGLIPVGIGSLFALIGAGLALTTMTASRGRIPQHVLGLGGPVDVFTRSPMRILVDLVLAPLGGLGFIAFAPVWVALAGPLGLVFGAIFVFFGVLVLWGSASTIRRGLRRAVAKVGPDGIWTPELPRRLRWDEIERVEVEAVRGAAGEGVAIYRRLAIWPRDPAIAARAPARRLVKVVRGFTRVVNVKAGEAGLSDPSKLAPYGIQAYDIEQDFGEVLRSVGRYARVIGAPEQPDAPFEPPVVEPTPPPTGFMGAVLANIADASAGGPSAPPQPAPSAAGPTAPAAAIDAAPSVNAPEPVEAGAPRGSG